MFLHIHGHYSHALSPFPAGQHDTGQRGGDLDSAGGWADRALRGAGAVPPLECLGACLDPPGEQVISAVAQSNIRPSTICRSLPAHLHSPNDKHKLVKRQAQAWLFRCIMPSVLHAVSRVSVATLCFSCLSEWLGLCTRLSHR